MKQSELEDLVKNVTPAVKDYELKKLLALVRIQVLRQGLEGLCCEQRFNLLLN